MTAVTHSLPVIPSSESISSITGSSVPRNRSQGGISPEQSLNQSPQRMDSPPSNNSREPALATVAEDGEMFPPSTYKDSVNSSGNNNARSGYGTMTPPVGATTGDNEVIFIKYPPSCRPDIHLPEMLVHLLWIAVPTLTANLFLYAAQTITMAFVGRRLGFDALAAFSVGISAFNICGAALGQGMCNALDTLASQAFGRDHQTPELGELLQRATLVNIGIWIPVSLLFLNSEDLLKKIYGEELGAHAFLFLHAAPCYLIAFYTTVAQTKIMQMQQKAYLPLMGHGIATAMCFLVNDRFLHPGDTVDKAAWVLCMCQVIVSTFLALCNMFMPSVITRNAQWPISSELWNKEKLLEYSKMGFSALTAVCAEWWAYEGLQVVAAQVGTTEVGAYTMMLNVLMVYFSISFGIATAGATMVGNALGANQPKIAWRYFLLMCAISIGSILCTASSLYFFGHDIMALFTTDLSVLASIDKVVHFFACYHAIAACQATLQGVFRGAAKQDSAAQSAVFGLWVIGFPLAIFFTLHMRWGLYGLFLGQGIGMGVLVPIFIIQVLRWDWEALAEAASSALLENLAGDGGGNQDSGSSTGKKKTLKAIHSFDEADEEEFLAGRLEAASSPPEGGEGGAGGEKKPASVRNTETTPLVASK